MASVISTRLNDCSHLRVVPVISSFDREGHITPLYVRLDGEPFKIYNAYISDNNTKILTFKCEIMVGESVRTIKLSYFVHDLVWCMRR